MLASIKTLLLSVVDYAGLFPPAKLDLQQAMANYACYQTTAYAWMLGRFVLPASRLREFTELLPKFSTPQQWRLSVILSQDIESDIKKVRSLDNNKAIAVTSLEIPPLPPTEIKKALSHLPKGVDSYFEIPLHSDIEAYLAVLSHTGASAKIRTGGVTVDAFPSVTQLYECMLAFAKAPIPFKATAGLHHPLLGKHPLTNEPDSPVAEMHGFLNVALVAALMYQQKITREEALELLKESSIEALQITQDSISWQDYQLNLVEIEQTRQKFFRSFGSCSFDEPIDDLKKLKLLS
ncbi:hypothetical protein ACF3DV_22775 [Chlorogloeopsis fritschii PCC 9212]|uniref:Uncharacterized protein n=1 Tax=Chlorogloeopsis fritschii PCC 6912 TaxID=211165 RepID=A0A433MZS2_CHLFR|nr:hypothetical protein [Chlorogloeopsis fritschii]RUR74053.1 hypothetical protein PCC6912_53610 [Chlorogloeopsis fritschii PCC 6912]